MVIYMFLISGYILYLNYESWENLHKRTSPMEPPTVLQRMSLCVYNKCFYGVNQCRNIYHILGLVEHMSLEVADHTKTF